MFKTGDDCIAGINVTNLTVRRCELNYSWSIFRLGGTHVLFTGTHLSEITFENVTVTNLLRPSCCKADPREPLTVHLKNVRTAWRDGGDRPLLARLQSFIPDKVFDAHCHPHRADFFPDDCNMFRAYGTADAKRCLADQKELHCDRKFHGLLLATPPTAWEVVNEREMSIAVHMVKPDAQADEKNMVYFKTMTAKYPHAKLFLAHCARGFASWTTVSKARELAGIPNIYYDMGAICDPATIFELIRQARPEHVMWGTDYFIDRAHGRPINTGEPFTWLYSHDLPEGLNIPMCKTALEALFAFWQASFILDLSRGDIEQVFYGTGTQLFGLKD